VSAARRQRLAVGLALALWAGAPAAQAPLVLPSGAEWGACAERRERLVGRREALRAAAEALALQRAAAGTAGDAGLERSLLARGEALADSIERLSVALLAEALRCAPAAERLDGEIAAALTGSAAATEAQRETLLALQARVRRWGAGAGRAEFPLPEAGEGDPPEILRQKAAYARDLIDRAGRWREIVEREARRGDGERLAREASRMLADQAFFEERAAMALDAAAAKAGDDFAALLAQAGEEAGGAGGAAEALARLRGFLAGRERELAQRAEELEREATRRESER